MNLVQTLSVRCLHFMKGNKTNPRTHQILLSSGTGSIIIKIRLSIKKQHTVFTLFFLLWQICLIYIED